MKKGRHRRFEEARLLKRSTEVVVEPCAECGAGPEEDHAAWCLATEEPDDDVLDAEDLATGPDQVVDHGDGPATGPTR